MDEISVGKILNAECDDVPGGFLVRVASVDFEAKTFQGEIFREKDVLSKNGRMQAPIIVGTWNFQGKSEDIPCTIKFKNNLKIVV